MHALLLPHCSLVPPPSPPPCRAPWPNPPRPQSPPPCPASWPPPPPRASPTRHQPNQTNCGVFKGAKKITGRLVARTLLSGGPPPSPPLPASLAQSPHASPPRHQPWNQRTPCCPPMFSALPASPAKISQCLPPAPPSSPPGQIRQLLGSPHPPPPRLPSAPSSKPDCC